MLWVCWLVLLGPLDRVGGGGEPVEGLVWLVGVVLGSPVLERDLGFEEVGEVFGVEAFVSQASVEGLDVGVSPRVIRTLPHLLNISTHERRLLRVHIRLDYILSGNSTASTVQLASVRATMNRTLARYLRHSDFDTVMRLL